MTAFFLLCFYDCSILAFNWAVSSSIFWSKRPGEHLKHSKLTTDKSSIKSNRAVCVLLLRLYGTLLWLKLYVGRDWKSSFNLCLNLKKTTTMTRFILFFRPRAKRCWKNKTVGPKYFTIFLKMRKIVLKERFFTVCVFVCMCVCHCFSLQGGQVAQPSRCGALTEVTCCLWRSEVQIYQTRELKHASQNVAWAVFI